MNFWTHFLSFFFLLCIRQNRSLIFCRTEKNTLEKTEILFQKNKLLSVIEPHSHILCFMQHTFQQVFPLLFFLEDFSVSCGPIFRYARVLQRNSIDGFALRIEDILWWLSIISSVNSRLFNSLRRWLGKGLRKIKYPTQRKSWFIFYSS